MTPLDSVQLIDVEASGLHLESYPVEVAILTAGARISSWLIAPEPEWTHWSREAERLHGLPRARLELEGVRPSVVVRQLSSLLARSNGIMYSDAAEWDFDWIKTLYLAVGATLDFQILPLQELLSEAQWQALKVERERLRRSGLYELHRAASDVRMLHAAYQCAVRLGSIR